MPIFAALSAGLVLSQDAVQFKFQPKVGEKIRYSMTMEDGEGHSMDSSDVKLFAIFKIAGLKDDKFTVHQFMDSSGGAKSEPKQIGSYRIDSLLNSEMISTDQATEAGTAGAAMASKLFGVFGVSFSSTPVKVGDTWKSPFDPEAVAKAFMESIAPNTDAKTDATGGVTVSLDKLDEKVGVFHTVMHMKFEVTLTDKGQAHHLTVSTDCDQTSSVDRVTGIPVKLDRKFSMSMKADAESNAVTMLIHMVKV